MRHSIFRELQQFVPPALIRSQFFNCFHTVLLSFQSLMEDGKRETAVSLLPMVPEDSDSGRTYTCRVLNPAAPAGRQTSVTINVQREYFLYILFFK